MNFPRTALSVSFLFIAATLSANIFGSIRGLIHDPQHRPVQGAEVTLHAENSNWTKSMTSDDSGEFRFDTVPLGEYQVTVAVSGFAPQEQKLVLASGRDARLHFSLTVATAKEIVEVSDAPATVNPESSTTTTVVSRQQIAETPGADQANSLAMITNFTPGAYMVHDQLHIRGGHQVSWLLDGVPVPNTNIASNVGPQFDPKDIDYLEVQRGGYSAEYGDRTYGVFNVVTRSGFERDRQGEFVGSYGSFNNTNDQISFGDHTDRFAYYTSLSGYRTDLGLQTPSTEIVNDQAAGLGGFASLIFNKSPANQLRLVTSLRGDHYQVPVDPAEQDVSNHLGAVQDERDAFLNFSWLHNTGNGILTTVSPFYHFNRAHYAGNPNDVPLVSEDDRGSNYFGGVASIAVTRKRHNARVGIQVFGQHDNQLLSLTDATQPPPDNSVRQRAFRWGSVTSVFLEDQYKPTSWLTLNGGLRLTHFEGSLSENAADPRFGAAIRIPRLNWVVRGFYGRYYQAPPLLTASGPLIEEAVNQGFGFLPLHGERDQQHEIGLAVPFHGWTLDVSYFRTAARNFFDHDPLDNSNIFFPLTIERARIRGWETTVNSPRINRRAQFHLAYSHQYVEGAGGVSGGFTEFEPPEEGYFLLDHDQRDTLAAGVHFELPWRAWTDLTTNYGSGFLDEDGPAHLPPHTTFDLALGKSFGENWNLRLTGLNLSNHRYLLDNSNTFGGTHYINPREISVQLRYRFRY